jgi:hypothetical protein
MALAGVAPARDGEVTRLAVILDTQSEEVTVMIDVTISYTGETRHDSV